MILFLACCGVGLDVVCCGTVLIVGFGWVGWVILGWFMYRFLCCGICVFGWFAFVLDGLIS